MLPSTEEGFQIEPDADVDAGLLRFDTPTPGLTSLETADF